MGVQDQNQMRKDIHRNLQMGIQSTAPYYISTDTLHTFDDLKGYVLQVLEECVINSASDILIDGDSFDGATLSPGHYHLQINAIQLDSGRAIVYRASKKY